MNEEKIAELQREIAELRAKINAESEASKAKLTTLIEGLTTEKVYIRWNTWVELGFEVSLLDPESGHGVFGTDIYVATESDYYGERVCKVKLNTGSCGSFGQDNAGQVFKYTMMAKLIENFGTLTELARDYHAKTYQVFTALFKAQTEEQRLRDANEEAEEDAKRAEALTMLKAGSWVGDGQHAYQVVKITEKMVFFKYWEFCKLYMGYDEETHESKYSNKWRCYTPSYKNGTEKKDDFIFRVVHGQYTIGEVPEEIGNN